MEFLIIVTVGVLIVAAAFLIPDEKATAETKAEEDAAVPAESGEPAPATLEGVLTAQLMRHEITPAQYRVAVARLAERDEERNPMSVPGTDLR